MLRLRRRPRLTVEPVLSYPVPRYPTIDSVARTPARLLDFIPEAWKSNASALSALAAFVLAAGRAQAEKPTQTPVPAEDTAATAQREVPKASAPAPSIAPVFIHGEGRGATGCVVISPPEFLSEAEALEVIWEELEREDLGFESRPVAVPVRAETPTAHSAASRSARAKASPRRPLFFDAYSPRLECGVLVVGSWNYDELDPSSGERVSSVASYDTLGVAQDVTERLGRESMANAGVFYDPLVKMRMRLQSHRRESGDAQDKPANAQDLLRAQVREFVDWAKKSMRVTQPEATQ